MWTLETRVPGRGSGGGTRARPRSRPSLRVARLPQQVVLEFALLLRRPQLRGLGLHVLRDCSGQPDKRLLGRGHPKRARKQSRARKAPRSTNFKKQATIKTFFFFFRSSVSNGRAAKGLLRASAGAVTN